MTDVALIPPYCRLGDLAGRPLQMMLPVCVHNEVYKSFFWALSTTTDTYVILDNGAFEAGKSLSDSELVSLALAMKVDEIIIPDDKDDPYMTFARQASFVHYARNEGYRGNFGTVVHGNGIRAHTQAKSYINKVANDKLFKDPPTLCFPRRLAEQVDRNIRLDLMDWTLRTYGVRFKFHLLGLNRLWPGELVAAKRAIGPQLRGCDTSAPYVYTAAGVTIADNAPSVDRHNNYFEHPDKVLDKNLLAKNIQVLDDYAKGLHELGWKPEEF